MRYSSSLLNNSSIAVLVLLLLACQVKHQEKPAIPKAEEVTFAVDTVKAWSLNKLQLTKDYCQQHYGLNDYRLLAPKMIVIHHTVIPTLRQTIQLFKRDSLTSNRKFINRFSPLNVGIHYVIDKDGAIYNLLPDSIVGRHLIGFNHVSLGIENVAEKKEDLTPAQLKSNAELVSFLTKRHPSIAFLIGHDEYNDTTLVHYSLFTSLDKSYQPYDKPDPGAKFMTELRAILNTKYGVVLEK